MLGQKEGESNREYDDRIEKEVQYIKDDLIKNAGQYLISEGWTEEAEGVLSLWLHFETLQTEVQQLREEIKSLEFRIFNIS